MRGWSIKKSILTQKKAECDPDLHPRLVAETSVIGLAVGLSQFAAMTTELTAAPGGTAQAEQPVWLDIARAELGVKPCPPGSSNPRITQYHADTNIRGYDDKVSWCSSFVNWVFGQAGIVGTQSALARSWAEWGQPLREPVLGCVVVLWREEPSSWKGHVGYYLRHDARSIYLFGGNQLECVCENAYPADTVLAYRWPPGVALPDSNGQ